MNIHSHPVSIALIGFCGVLASANQIAAQIIMKEPIVAPTLYTGPAPVGFRVASTTPASASFSWSASTGAVSYQLMRSATAGGSWTYLAPNPIPASTLSYTDNGGIDYRSTYTYRLQVNYSSGPSGYVDIPVTLPKPLNPTSVTAKQTGPGSVTISWLGNGNTVLGPNVPNNGAITVTDGLQTYTVTGLENGKSYTWQVATFWQPGNVSTPASEFPSASATVLPYTGNYRITLLGFSANNPTDDDILDSDGKADEIMPMVYVRQFYQPTGNTLGSSNAKGYVHGDNQGKFRSRVRAGTASNSGGIQKNDVFPAGLMQGTIGSPSTTTFPLKVFEGSLTRDNQVLVLYPSLWEIDDAPSRWFDTYLSALPARTVDALNPGTAVGLKLRQALDAPGISEIRGDPFFRMDTWGLTATGDRPIGIESTQSADGQGGFYDRIIVLTQRKIEEALAAPPKIPNMPAGTIGLSFTEGGVLRVTGTPDPTSWNFPGSYVLYLRVEALR